MSIKSFSVNFVVVIRKIVFKIIFGQAGFIPDLCSQVPPPEPSSEDSVEADKKATERDETSEGHKEEEDIKFIEGQSQRGSFDAEDEMEISRTLPTEEPQNEVAQVIRISKERCTVENIH